jgi:cation transport ATPase
MGGTMIQKILTKLCVFSSEQLIGIANKALNDRQEILERSEKEKARFQTINSRLLARLAMTEKARNEAQAEIQRLNNLEIARQQNLENK